MAEFWRSSGGESMVSNGAKSRNTRDALTTFVVLGPKGLKCSKIMVNTPQD